MEWTKRMTGINSVDEPEEITCKPTVKVRRRNGVGKMIW
jgi:hypothetical protein